MHSRETCSSQVFSQSAFFPLLLICLKICLQPHDHTQARSAGCRGVTHPPANPHRYRLRAELETPRMRSRTVGPSQQAHALHGIRPLCKDPSRGSSSSSHKVPSGASSTSSNITPCHSPRGFTGSTIHDSYQTRRSRLLAASYLDKIKSRRGRSPAAVRSTRHGRLWAASCSDTM